MGEHVIEVRGLVKRYPDITAVDGIEFDVSRGQVFSLLGPNGAGKTTTVEILEGHRTADAGEVRVLGHDPARRERALLERIRIVLQETGIEPFLTVEEAIDLYRGYYPHPRSTGEILHVVGLEEKASSRVNKLSGGQKRRLDVGIGLAGDPDLLFLDEPTTGYDPSARRNAWQVVKNLAALGKTIVLTTHYMDEAQNLADRVAIVVGGRIVAVGPPGLLGGTELEQTRITFSLPMGPGPKEPPALPASLGAAAAGNGYVIVTQDPVQMLHDLTGWALAEGIVLVDLSVSKPSLEDVYLQLTGGIAGTE